MPRILAAPAPARARRQRESTPATVADEVAVAAQEHRVEPARRALHAVNRPDHRGTHQPSEDREKDQRPHQRRVAGGGAGDAVDRFPDRAGADRVVGNRRAPAGFSRSVLR